MPAFTKTITHITEWIIVLLLVSGCKDIDKNKTAPSVNSTPKMALTDTIYNTILKNDSITIYTEVDSITIKKNELLFLGDSYNDLMHGVPQQPDIAWSLNIKQAIANHDSTSRLFSSEIGKDGYYTVYGFLLKIRNGEFKYRGQRDTLIKMYRLINEINGQLTGGGTYFGHQYSRILGYAEYAIYTDTEEGEWYTKSYSIKKQKENFITSIKQLINDQVNGDLDVFAIKDRKAKQKELFALADSLGNLIKNYFYLKQAQQFQYSNY